MDFEYPWRLLINKRKEKKRKEKPWVIVALTEQLILQIGFGPLFEQLLSPIPDKTAAATRKTPFS
jgi:hypothetical protein